MSSTDNLIEMHSVENMKVATEVLYFAKLYRHALHYRLSNGNQGDQKFLKVKH